MFPKSAKIMIFAWTGSSGASSWITSAIRRWNAANDSRLNRTKSSVAGVAGLPLKSFGIGTSANEA